MGKHVLTYSFSFEDFAFLMDGIKNGKKKLILPILQVEDWNLEVLSCPRSRGLCQRQELNLCSYILIKENQEMELITMLSLEYNRESNKQKKELGKERGRERDACDCVSHSQAVQ